MFVFALLPVARQICVFLGHRAGLKCASLLTFSACCRSVAWRLRLLLPEHSWPTGGGQKGGSAGKMKGFDVPFAVFLFLVCRNKEQRQQLRVSGGHVRHRLP